MLRKQRHLFFYCRSRNSEAQRKSSDVRMSWLLIIFFLSALLCHRKPRITRFSAWRTHSPTREKWYLEIIQVFWNTTLTIYIHQHLVRSDILKYNFDHLFSFLVLEKKFIILRTPAPIFGLRGSTSPWIHWRRDLLHSSHNRTGTRHTSPAKEKTPLVSAAVAFYRSSFQLIMGAWHWVDSLAA